MIEGTKIGTTSDEDGKFSFDEIAVGNYSIVFTAIGYETKKENVIVSSGRKTELTISMKESSV